jgi:endoglucanase
MGVSVGDVLTWDSPLTELGRSRISSKALDDRLGCFTMLSLAQQIQQSEISCDLWLVFITREEIMLNGAVPFMNKISPDVLIGVDGTLPFDTPDLENGQCDIRLGAGPASSGWMLSAAKVQLYADYPLARKVRALARQLDIPLQMKLYWHQHLDHCSGLRSRRRACHRSVHSIRTTIHR